MDRNSHHFMTGRDAISALRPMLGLENTPGIREIDIHIGYNEAVTVEVRGFMKLRKSKFDVRRLFDSEQTRKYIVTVTPVDD